MCEFKVIINGNTIFKNAVYAKANGSNVIVKDIFGDLKEFQNYQIVEFKVNTQ